MMRLLPALLPLALTGCIAVPDGAAASHALAVLAILAVFPIGCLVGALPFVAFVRH